MGFAVRLSVAACGLTRVGGTVIDVARAVAQRAAYASRRGPRDPRKSDATTMIDDHVLNHGYGADRSRLDSTELGDGPR
ncbi:MAG: hypothetical protein H6825_00305 [Planctomycetes bacterium]|nr:hypothetical protein [Planctomycetota bacterium]